MSTNRSSSPEDSLVFISYSHLNCIEKDKLLMQFGALKSEQVKTNAWADNDIGAGEDWRQKIEEAMARCDAAVLLITDAFLDSEFIQTVEVPTLLKRRQKDRMAVVPVLAQDCAWQAVSWLKAMQIRPNAAKPVWGTGGDVNKDLAAIVMEVHKLIVLAQERRKQATLEAKERAKAELAALAKSNAVQEMIDEFRNASLAGRWEMQQEAQAKMFKDVEDVIMNRRARNSEMLDRWEKYIRSTE